MARAKNDSQSCACGCGAVVKRSFLPGHDQLYLSSLCNQVATGTLTSARANELASSVSPRFASRVAQALVMVEALKARERIRQEAA